MHFRFGTKGRFLSFPKNVLIDGDITQALCTAVDEYAASVGRSGKPRVGVVCGGGCSRQIAEERIITGFPDTNYSVVFVPIDNNRIATVEELDVEFARHAIDSLIAVGGGKVIDVSKTVAYRRQAQLIVVPTALSSDGIASPISILKDEDGRNHSRPAEMPAAVMVDVSLVSQAPRRMNFAGLGDLLSNSSALLDWDCAVQAGKDTRDGFARIMSEASVDLVVGSSDAHKLDTDDVLKKLASGLILSGIAMGFAGSSRPCSGAEHLISHAIDYYGFGDGLHGEQVALATMYMDQLRASAGKSRIDARTIELLRRSDLPSSPQDIGVSRDQFIKAVSCAPQMRPERYTVLDDLNSDTSYADVYDTAFDA